MLRRYAEPGCRLITLAHAGEITTAEVAHEALFDHWILLRQWLDEGRNDLRFERQLNDAINDWRNHGAAEGLLWRPPRLDLLREYADRSRNQLTYLQAEFLQACDTYDRHLKLREAELKVERQLSRFRRGLNLAYIGFLIVSGTLLLSYLYFATARVMERQTKEIIQADVNGLAEQYRAEGLARLRQVIESRNAAQPNWASVYLLTDPLGQRVAGNLDRWPDVQPGHDGWMTFTIDVQPDGVSVERRRMKAQAFIVAGGSRLLIGRDAEELMQFQRGLIMQALGWGLGCILLLGFLFWWPVRVLTTQRREILLRHLSPGR